MKISSARKVVPFVPKPNEDRVSAYLLGIGVKLPDKHISNAAIAKNLVDLTDSEIESLTGIHERRFAEGSENTSDFATAAAHGALHAANLSPNSIDLILLATSTPDHLMPATACRVQDRLGARSATAMDLNAACSGFLYALYVGQQFIQNEEAKRVLVIGAEVMSRITDPHDRQTALLFGDGAGAVVLGAGSGIYRLGRMWTATKGEQYSYISRGGGVDVNRTCPFVQMHGHRVFRSAIDNYSEAILKTLEKNGMTLPQVEQIVPHQANQRIFEGVATKLSMNVKKIFTNIDHYGNTAAASIPIALNELLKREEDPPKTIVLASVGAGITSAGALLIKGK